MLYSSPSYPSHLLFTTAYQYRPTLEKKKYSVRNNEKYPRKKKKQLGDDWWTDSDWAPQYLEHTTPSEGKEKVWYKLYSIYLKNLRTIKWFSFSAKKKKRKEKKVNHLTSTQPNLTWLMPKQSYIRRK